MAKLPPTDISILPVSPDAPEYRALLKYLNDKSVHEDDRAHLFRVTCERDFWFFCRFATSARFFICEIAGCDYQGRHIYDHPFLFERCREFQAEPDGYLDLWPRGHFKTTTITTYGTFWNFLHRPSDTVAIITWELDEVGNAMIAGMQRELEADPVPGHGDAKRNDMLAYHWPEIFWRDPRKEAKVWKSGAMNLKQHPGTRENSILAMSLNAIRTSQHYHLIVPDDIVVEKSSYTPEACEDCTEKFKKTTPLRHTAIRSRLRAVGTRWASNDTYRWIIDEGVLKLRNAPMDCYFPQGHDLEGQSVLHPGVKAVAWLDEWRKSLGETLFAANMRNRPIDEQSVHIFRPDWFDRRGYAAAPEEIAQGANLYFFVDPARPKDHAKGKKTDYLAIVGIAIRPDGKRYVIEMVRDRMDAETTVDVIFSIDLYWRRQGNPIRFWWWELRGSSWDMAFWKLAMDQKSHRFDLIAFEDKEPKDTRIGRLFLPFERGEIVLPAQHWSPIHPQMDGGIVNMTQIFLKHEVYRWRPTMVHYNRVAITARNEDLLDALAQSESPEVKRYLEVPVGGDEADEMAALEKWRRDEDLKRKRRNTGVPAEDVDAWAW